MKKTVSLFAAGVLTLTLCLILGFNLIQEFPHFVDPVQKIFYPILVIILLAFSVLSFFGFFKYGILK